MVRHLSTRPAELFGLHDKGRVAPGADADLVFFAPDDTWMLTARSIRAKCGWSAYEGWTMTGRMKRTMRRGHVVWDADSVAFGSYDGRWIQ
ncbi:amidohydrolase family protein [Streptomyces sp. NPDC005951]|uniref:amidohydrolase family protein n=1 Tax=Streptomyces sp. NPDC005951 TaxID=3154573 RepID=UPI0033D4B4B4